VVMNLRQSSCAVLSVRINGASIKTIIPKYLISDKTNNYCEVNG
jgi:hypothetical protein